MSLTSALLALLPALAYARDVIQCKANVQYAPYSAIFEVDNTGGLNALPLFACTSPPCTAPSTQVDCGLTVPSNSTFYVNITLPSPILGVTLVYTASQAFSFHPLTSSQPIAFNASLPLLRVPYPTPGALLCDTSVDCPALSTCVVSPSPPRCGPPSPAPTHPPTPPVPSPSPNPAAASSCTNITSNLWEQRSLGASLGGQGTHTADAYITMVSLAGGGFTFACKASHKPCPGGVQLLNGTGSFSPTGSQVTLTPSPGSGVGVITGVVNSTYTCNTMTLLTGVPAPLVWDYYGPNPHPTPFNTDVSVATFLGGGALGLFTSTGVAILSPTTVCVSGNGAASAYPGGIPITLLMGANATSNATLLLVSTESAPATKVVGVVKVGGRVDHVRANGEGTVAIAGDFGVAVVKGLVGGSSPSISWHDALDNVTPGSCGVCCSNGGKVTCRVDIGEDGTVAANLAASTANEQWLWGAWDPSGKRVLAETVGGASLTDVMVDSPRKAVGAAWFYNSNTGKEPMVMPAIAMQSYPGGEGHYRLFDWDAHVYREPGPCNGNVADGRIMSCRIGRDGTLLVGGRSDGGDTPFACGMRNVSRVVPLAQIDDYTNPSNMQAQAITDFMRVDGTSGEVMVGQIQVARLPNGHGNTLFTVGAQSDTQGNVYLLQNAGCCLPNMPNLTINGMPLAGWSDSAALHILDSRLERRYTWTHFSKPNATGGGVPVDIDVRGGVVALTIMTNADFVEVNKVEGSSSNVGGANVGYLVLLPTIPARGAA